MNSTDAALAWLLSLPATCTSSPFRPSSSPAHLSDFTDWFHFSPSPSPTRPSSYSSPLQDVSSSSRVNPPQERNGDIFSHALPDVFNASNHIQTGRSDNSILSTSDTTSLISDRLVSLESSSTTLVNSPSLFESPSIINQYSCDLAHTGPMQCSLSLNPPTMFPSPASKLINDLTSSPFGTFLNFYDSSATAITLPALSFSDVSPVVRASRKADESLLIDKEKEPAKRRKKKSKPRKASSFLTNLKSATIQQRLGSPSPLSLPAQLPSPLDLPDNPFADCPALLSPVKLPTPAPPQATLEISDPRPSSPEPHTIPAPVFTTPLRPYTPTNAPFSPLSPLTPLSSPTYPEPEPSHSLKIKIILKRKNCNPMTPIRRTKRPRRTIVIDSSSPIQQPSSNNAPPASDDEAEPSKDENSRPAYSNRTLPINTQISSTFPLLYRRFPASSYYQPPDADSPCTLFGVSHPGGNYNPPRWVFDLYTPRFVKGRGSEKVGLCPICVEPVSRGGENKKLWLAMKFSAFKCYHMQYAHGISASTGKPFSPPTAFRVVPRQNATKKEKHHIQQGKCHKCLEWVFVEGVKDMESKVPELYWWKHAATCHHDSSLEGEGEYFEKDEVYAKLITLEHPMLDA